MKKVLSNVSVIVSLVVISLILMAFIFSAAGDIIMLTVRSVASVIGYGSVMLSVVVIICLTAIIFSVSGRFVGAQWFAYVMARSAAKKAVLEADFEFRVLERDQQAYLFSRPDSQIVGRNVSLETEPFTTMSLDANSPISVAKWQLLNSPKPVHVKNDSVPLLEPAHPQLPLLPAIAHADNVLIVGGKGSGKTTLMQWIEYERLSSGQEVIVLDSHAMPSQWRGQMIGQQRNYLMIKSAMLALVDKLHSRYERRSRGEVFNKLNCFIDEFTLLPKVLKKLDFDIQDYSLPVLTEGRKVGLNAVWGIHSDRVRAMGLEGAGDIKECFDAIVYLKSVKGERYALVDFGEGIEDTKYQHPGPFIIDNAVQLSDEILEVEEPEPEPEPEPDRIETIRRLHSEGLSNQQIAEYFGYRSCSGRFFYELKDALGDNSNGSTTTT